MSPMIARPYFDGLRDMQRFKEDPEYAEALDEVIQPLEGVEPTDLRGGQGHVRTVHGADGRGKPGAGEAGGAS